MCTGEDTGSALVCELPVSQCPIVRADRHFTRRGCWSECDDVAAHWGADVEAVQLFALAADALHKGQLVAGAALEQYAATPATPLHLSPHEVRPL